VSSFLRRNLLLPPTPPFFFLRRTLLLPPTLPFSFLQPRRRIPAAEAAREESDRGGVTPSHSRVSDYFNKNLDFFMQHCWCTQYLNPILMTCSVEPNYGIRNSHNSPSQPNKHSLQLAVNSSERAIRPLMDTPKSILVLRKLLSIKQRGISCI
jgi:hypothetical protein